MGGHDHAAPRSCELRDDLQDPDLIAVVEGSGWFVEHQDGRLLDQGAGDQRQLALAAGQQGERTIGPMGYAEMFELVDRQARSEAVGAAMTPT